MTLTLALLVALITKKLAIDTPVVCATFRAFVAVTRSQLFLLLPIVVLNKQLFHLLNCRLSL